MPTARPRHQVTETADVARALEVAARRWPGEPRALLLRRMVLLAERTLEDETATVDEARRAAIGASSGKYADAFPAGFLESLRADWPA